MIQFKDGRPIKKSVVAVLEMHSDDVLRQMYLKEYPAETSATFPRDKLLSKLADKWILELSPHDEHDDDAPAAGAFSASALLC